MPESKPERLGGGVNGGPTHRRADAAPISHREL